jgi:protein-L-isoaspartate(D-aspartate) O-methyltransferase
LLHREPLPRVIPHARWLLVAALLGSAGCLQQQARADRHVDDATAQRAAMVREQIAARGVHDARVLRALRQVPRHLFIPACYRAVAYGDHPLPIGEDQTISQPYIVGFMTEALRVGPGARVLEIGTGSGYQAAVLAEVAKEVYSIEIIAALSQRSNALLRQLGYRNVQLRVGDGYAGWPEKAPFDAIIVTAAPPRVPKPLLAQLKVGGALVAPVGRSDQELVRVTRVGQERYKSERLLGVRFVPMTGKAQRE